MIVKCDDRGRLLLFKEIRDFYGDEFYVVKAPKEIVLIPVPENPLMALEEEGKKIPKKITIEQMKKEIDKSALKSAKEDADRIKRLRKRR